MFSNPEAPKQIPSTQSLKEALEYPILPKAFADHDLPSIPSSKVIEMNGDSGGRLWLVIDRIVYDCSNFVASHPGGDTVIKSFAGKDCSWQFYKVHGTKKNRQWLPTLRVGTTQGVQNPFPEPKSGYRRG